MASNTFPKDDKLNNKLQIILDSEGLSQAELAQVSGINATTISLICRGVQKHPRNATKARLTKGVNKLVGNDKYGVIDIFMDGFL